MLKNSDINLLVYILTFYVSAQIFVEKQHFIWRVQKKTKKYPVRTRVIASKLVFFTGATIIFSFF